MEKRDDKILAILKSAGWQEGRTLDRDKIIRAIEAEGYTPMQVVVKFLEEFNNIEIFFENEGNAIGKSDIIISFEKAILLEVPERIKGDYVPRIGKDLCPIGTAYSSHLVLMMASDGSVYGGFDDSLCEISSSGLGAVLALVSGRTPKFIE
ncbi:SUKH-3 domain-containing protein [Pseudoflavitalea rhizosphaerae]|uniref:SUKH-3 domain-containing protein n=1 Tax=Pseudoflavitalea rhizosphaerae TaxID=1884793 RepID=UPI0013DFBE06|nr:SUKH-3 domain-containing protein [Pseudoflavitalea rhizosphaerae]